MSITFILHENLILSPADLSLDEEFNCSLELAMIVITTSLPVAECLGVPTSHLRYFNGQTTDHGVLVRFPQLRLFGRLLYTNTSPISVRAFGK